MNDVDVFKKGLCAECGRKVVSRWCDYHIEYTNDTVFARSSSIDKAWEFARFNSGRKNETCDLPICEDCATEIAHDVHFCTHHYGIYLKAKRMPTKKLKNRRVKEHSKIMCETLKGADE